MGKKPTGYARQKIIVQHKTWVPFDEWIYQRNEANYRYADAVRSNIGYALDQQKQQERHKAFVENAKKTQYSDSEEKERAMGGLTHYKATELCRSDTSSKALFCGIRSRSKLKERRLISDSSYPGGFAARLLFSPLLSIPYLCREMRRNYERTLIPVIRSVKHISTCGESPELNHGAHF